MARPSTCAGAPRGRASAARCGGWPRPTLARRARPPSPSKHRWRVSRSIAPSGSSRSGRATCACTRVLRSPAWSCGSRSPARGRSRIVPGSNEVSMRRRVSLLFVAAVFAATPAAAQTRAGSVPLLLSTAWLEEHLQESDVVVLYTDQGAHDEALIAGARAVPHESLMTMQGGHGLASTDVLVEALRKAGVSNDSHVVVYGEPLSVGWLFFVLEYLGHPRVSVLDASITKWRAENRPFARTPVAPPRGTFTPSPRPQLRATADDVRAQRSEERRVGKSVGLGGSRNIKRKRNVKMIVTVRL